MRKKNLLLLSAAGMSAALGLLAFGPAIGQTPGPFTQDQVEAGRAAFAANQKEQSGE